jgi:hypothetical protein
MKSAYELAMERLQAADKEPAKTLTDAQKEQLAEIERSYQARVAEREVFLNQQLNKARAARKGPEVERLERQIRDERQRLRDEAEAEKEKIRRGH